MIQQARAPQIKYNELKGAVTGSIDLLMHLQEAAHRRRTTFVNSERSKQ